MFLSMYLLTVLGNLLFILAVSSDLNLHTPMYFLLSNLSLADIGFTSATIPNMLTDIHIHHRIISYVSCLIQLSFFTFFVCMDNLLLTALAYDRFVAVCYPLHYPVIMNSHFCGFLVLVSFFLSLLDSQLHCLIVLQLTFCKEAEIPHFCDPSQLINLACSDKNTTTKNILVYIMGAIFGGVPVSAILFSYTRILSSVLRVPSLRGKYKAFSTCGSHFSVVCLFYGTGIGVYLSSAVSPSFRSGAEASVMYSVVTRMLNPFIYCLRNRDIKKALQRLLRQ
ncbi:olfactory receptor 18-like [Elephas maximus indicus]|uniref:olfactory receptor 18-like n=1 Tax=Elephas maximus indicus TaxID=99487 RepID=UPI002117226E|nr:olfactory receptor 18-like [Elephas maximus indicus]